MNHPRQKSPKQPVLFHCDNLGLTKFGWYTDWKTSRFPSDWKNDTAEFPNLEKPPFCWGVCALQPFREVDVFSLEKSTKKLRLLIAACKFPEKLGFLVSRRVVETLPPPKFHRQLAPETWWLEDDPFLLGFGNSSGENSLVNFRRVTKTKQHPLWVHLVYLSFVFL